MPQKMMAWHPYHEGYRKRLIRLGEKLSTIGKDQSAAKIELEVPVTFPSVRLGRFLHQAGGITDYC